MSNDDELRVKWAADAAKLLVGRRIVKVRYMTVAEQKGLGWYRACIVLHLDDGNIIYPSADDEGNDAGALFTNDEKMPVIPVI